MKGIIISSAGSALVASVMTGAAGTAGLTTMVYPVESRVVTSSFGERVDPITGGSGFHTGVDIAAARGSEIRAVSDGVVVFVGKLGGYGLLVSIRHQGGITTHYGHCEKAFVKVGESVRAGHLIAAVGSTGRTTGPHLHLETRVLGAPLNPTSVLSALKPRGSQL